MSAYGVSGAISAALGAGQLIAGALMKPKRPTYKIPTEIGENVNFAKRLYGASTLYGMPGQGAINNQNQSTLATALRSYQNSQQNPAAMLAGITATTANQQRSNADIGIRAAMDRRNAMNSASARVFATNKDLASYKDKAFQINEFDPFDDERKTKSALIGGGIQNFTGGLTTLGSAKYRKTMDDYYRSKI